ncbi:MAG: helix-turn-helix domain-containing protein [Bacteroidia bacterium]|nr:helix-turn-helix domain-containing protein [Bacteroidia bacterium]
MIALIRPAPPLRPYVICYAAASARFENLEHHIVSARGVPMLMFPFKAPSDTGFLHGRDGSRYPSRMLDSPALLTANSVFAQTYFQGQVNFVMVILQMTAAYHLLRCSVKGMANQVNLLDFYGLDPMFRELQERLWRAADSLAACQLIEQYLIRYFTRKHPPRLNGLEDASRYLMTASAGRTDVGGLADQTGRSERWLQEQFAHQTGLSPKSWLCLLRFRAAASYWVHHPGCSWLDLVERFGYTDQSHLIREFRQYTGSAPVRHFSNHGRTEQMLHMNDPGLFGTSAEHPEI